MFTLTGNRCGHDKYNPKFYKRPSHHKKRPLVLEQAIERLENAFYKRNKYLKNLNIGDRQKRSERIEAVVAVSQAMLHYLELWTLKVGIFCADGSFRPLDLEFIAKHAGLSVIRTRRAISDLAKAGYLKVTRQFKKDNGLYTGLASIREFCVSFFTDLGVDFKLLVRMREWKRKRVEHGTVIKSNTYKKSNNLSDIFRNLRSKIVG